MPVVQVVGDVDPVALAQELSAALGESIEVEVMSTEGNRMFWDAPSVSDVDTAARVLKEHRTDENRQFDQLVAKARQVWSGQGTFTQAQAQKILAGLVLLENRRR